MSQRITEYYDLFDIKFSTVASTSSMQLYNDVNPILPSNQKSTNTTNPFSGFNNFPYTGPYANTASSVQEYQPPPNEPSQYITITGQHKAPQAVTNIRIDENGDIWCFPPNVSVPYWNRIIFRHYDYTVNIDPDEDIKLATVCDKFNNTIHYSIYPTYEYDSDGNKYLPSIIGTDGAITNQDRLLDYSNVPLFVLCDEYPSRSKVVFSKGDITKAADIELNFSYHKGQMEPIKLNLSLSCNSYINDGSYKYNKHLTLNEMQEILVKCNFSIEWCYDRDSGN